MAQCFTLSAMVSLLSRFQGCLLFSLGTVEVCWGESWGQSLQQWLAYPYGQGFPGDKAQGNYGLIVLALWHYGNPDGFWADLAEYGPEDRAWLILWQGLLGGILSERVTPRSFFDWAQSVDQNPHFTATLGAMPKPHCVPAEAYPHTPALLPPDSLATALPWAVYYWLKTSGQPRLTWALTEPWPQVAPFARALAGASLGHVVIQRALGATNLYPAYPSANGLWLGELGQGLWQRWAGSSKVRATSAIAPVGVMQRRSGLQLISQTPGEIFP